MRTAIFVYESTTLTIETDEANLQLARMGTSSPVTLVRSQKLAFEPGVYKIVSARQITIHGDAAKMQVEVSLGKDTFPQPPPKGMAERLPGIETAKLQAFFDDPGSKTVARV